MKDKKTIKNILIGLAIAILALVGYAVFNSKGMTIGETSGGLSSKIGSSTTGQIIEKDTVVTNTEILKILGNIENIELNDDIFLNPIFRKLKDKSFSIPRPARIGRSNPFLPAGYGAVIRGGNNNVANSRESAIVSNFINSQNERNNFFDQVNANSLNTSNNQDTSSEA